MNIRLISDVFHSDTLGGRRVYRLLLPEPRPARKLPLLILLHGVHGSEIDWTEKGGVTPTLQAVTDEGHVGPMAVLMPSDGLAAIGTGFLNWDAGKPHLYEDMLLKELIPHVEQQWNVGGSATLRSIGGLSMGGYAAFRLALSYPEHFASASSLSGFFDVRELGELIGTADFERIFQGNRQRMDAVSPLTMALPTLTPSATSETIPSLYFDCGEQDKYIGMNRAMRSRLDSLAIPHLYKEHSGGHTWDYWKAHVREHLIFHWDQFC